MHTPARIVGIAIALGASLLAGCPSGDTTGPAASPCQVALPTSLSAAQGATVRANLDAAYAGFKGSAGTAVDAKSKIDATFATVSDANVTCGLILRTVTCALEHHDDTVAMGFRDVAREKCGGPTAPGTSASAPAPAASPH